jgi:hypothetical protein
MHLVEAEMKCLVEAGMMCLGEVVTTYPVEV